MGIGAAVAVAGAYLLGRAVTPLLPRARNHRGREIPQGIGVALFLPAMWLAPRQPDLLTGALAMGVVGLLDDFAGRGEPRGWLGHARAGRLTCGRLKALTGIGVALILAHGHWLIAPLLALGPNLVNTVDTRPGRAILFYCAAAALAPGGLQRALPFGAAALGLLPLDLGERAMLGDAGSNALGFALAFAWAGAPQPAPAVAAIAAAALIVLGDRFSLGRLGRRRSHAAPGE